MKIVNELTGTLGYVLFKNWNNPVVYGSLEKVNDPQYDLIISEIEKISQYNNFSEFKQKFESDFNDRLQKYGYQQDTRKRSSPTAIFSDYGYRLDFIRNRINEPIIGIEIEKTERRFGVRDVMKILLAFNWENSLLDVGIIIFPLASHASGSTHATSALKEINNFLIPIISQFHLWVIKNKLGIITVDWREIS